MIPTIPLFITLFFVLITIGALRLFYKVIKNAADPLVQKKATPILIGIILWLIIQGGLALSGVYASHLEVLPPALFRFGFLPVLLLFLYLFISKRGRIFLDTLPLKQLAFMNVIRLPIEIGLYLVYLYGAIPKLMTFEGGNLDILSGLSAPVIVYFMFTKRTLSPKLFLLWHFICLGLLTNIVVRALLSAPFPTQKFGFDQPNIAILYFPFVWLPTFMVMAVLFGHLTSIRKLILKK
jgi:hypothetical protein